MEIVEYKKDERGNIICQRADDGWEIFYEYDANNNCICVSDSSKKYKIIRRYDENNRVIYNKSNDGREKFYKYAEGERISITKQEFEKIKRIEEHKEFISRNDINPFELLDLE